MNRPVSTERKTDRTRERIMSAFTSQVFAGGFESVTVRRLLEEADVARSTFYEHFSNKEDVIRACMSRFFAVIADCILDDLQPPELTKVLAHLWEKRRLTDAIFSGQARVVLARNLIDLVESRLRTLAAGNATLPARLAATQIAEGQMALVESWMRGRGFCTVEHLADGLHRTSRASALALLS